MISAITWHADQRADVKFRLSNQYSTSRVDFHAEPSKASFKFSINLSTIFTISNSLLTSFHLSIGVRGARGAWARLHLHSLAHVNKTWNRSQLHWTSTLARCSWFCCRLVVPLEWLALLYSTACDVMESFGVYSPPFIAIDTTLSDSKFRRDTKKLFQLFLLAAVETEFHFHQLRRLCSAQR